MKLIKKVLLKVLFLFYRYITLYSNNLFKPYFKNAIIILKSGFIKYLIYVSRKSNLTDIRNKNYNLVMTFNVNFRGEYMNNNITEEHIKEGISRGYIESLINYAGYNTYRESNDYGFDGGFSEVMIRGNRRVSNGFKVDYQLKSSSNITINNGYVIYDLEVKNYNDLVDPNVGTPRILFLYHLPKDFNQYISVSQDQTLFKHCAYWCSLKNEQPTTNKEKKRIRIPVSNIVTRDSIINIMAMAKGGEL